MKVSISLIAILWTLPASVGLAADAKKTSHLLDRGLLPEVPQAGGNTGSRAEVPELSPAEIARRLPSAEPASPNFAPGLDVSENNRIWQGCPSMAISPKGRVWIAFLSGGRWEYDYRCEQTYVVLYTSGDGGRTFQGPVAAIKSQDGGNCHAADPGLWIDPLGRLWWTCIQQFPISKLKPNELTAGLIAHVTVNPDDEHPTWQPPRIIAPASFINKPTVLDDGTWLISPWFSALHLMGRWKPESFDFKGVFLYGSRDQGKSFSFISAWNSTPPAEAPIPESMTVVRKDGKRALYVRTVLGMRQCISADGGVTWSPPEPLTGIAAECDSRFFIRRLQSGRLLLVYNNGKRRLYLTAVLSDDDGKTWTGGLRLDDRDSLPTDPKQAHGHHLQRSTYPDGQQTPDGAIWIAYDLGRYAAEGREIVLARFREEDVLAGKIVSPDSRLKVRVSKATAPRPDYEVGNVNAPIGETLYNGIQLPFLWPPRTGDVRSVEPMRVPYLDHPPQVISIDVGRQLFVDDFLIEKTDLKRTFHQAEKHPANPVFKAETAHELSLSSSGERGQAATCYLGHGGVFYDPRDAVFKMFYTAGWRGGLALATSRDLVHWARPDLGFPPGGNLLLAQGPEAGHDDCVWLDLHSPRPAERIKFLTCWGSHVLKTSADGREWSQPVPTGKAGDYCSFFYNPFRHVWVFSIKQGGPRGRCRWYSENKDFLQGADWSKSVYWTNADRLDLPEPEGGYPSAGEPTQLYSLSAVAYESLLLGMHMIHRGPGNQICEKEKFPKLSDLELGFSRDGFHWHRPDRRPFIAASRKEGTWDRAYVHTTAGVCLVLDDKLWFPYTAFSGAAPDGTRGMYTGGAIGMATLRRDGFASLDADEKPGTLTTRPLTFQGEHLFVNLEAPHGELRVEVLDESGKVIAPFAAANSVPLRCDKTCQRVVWQGADGLAAVQGKPVRLRFTLRGGSLYSFWVTPDADGASHGYVGAGGPGFHGTLDADERE